MRTMNLLKFFTRVLKSTSISNIAILRIWDRITLLLVWRIRPIIIKLALDVEMEFSMNDDVKLGKCSFIIDLHLWILTRIIILIFSPRVYVLKFQKFRILGYLCKLSPRQTRKSKSQRSDFLIRVVPLILILICRVKTTCYSWIPTYTGSDSRNTLDYVTLACWCKLYRKIAI